MYLPLRGLLNLNLLVLVFSFVSVLLTLAVLPGPPLRYWYLFFYPMVLASSSFGLRGALTATIMTYGAEILIVAGLLPFLMNDALATVEDFPSALAGTALLFIVAARLGYSSDRKNRADENARHVANHDQLTGLLNRRGFLDALETSDSAAESLRGQGALLYIDLDYLKTVNDRFGHAAGDQLLCAVATILCQQTRDSDILGRLGGDEFAILLVSVDKEEARLVASRILRAIRDSRTQLAGEEVGITASIGIAFISEDKQDVNALLKEADDAMYRVKEAGRDGLAIGLLLQ